MDKTALRAAQARRDDELRHLNTTAAKRYLGAKAQQQSTGLIREVLAGVVFVTTAVAVIVIALAL
jgi:hypothetical protein